MIIILLVLSCHNDLYEINPKAGEEKHPLSVVSWRGLVHALVAVPLLLPARHPALQSSITQCRSEYYLATSSRSAFFQGGRWPGWQGT